MLGPVMLVSGGLDSTVMLTEYLFWNPKAEVIVLNFDYGQRHIAEKRALRAVVEHLRDRFAWAGIYQHTITIDWDGLLKGNSQTDETVPVPEGHYTAESMKSTVVPYRNTVMLFCAAAVAEAHGLGTVYYAAHAGDHAIYADCRPDYVKDMQRMFISCVNDRRKPSLLLQAPFINRTKADIVSLGAELKAPMHLTWSCYKGGQIHCGRCGTCVERREAFELAKVPDPTTYA